MDRETAITEDITYKTSHCDLCSSEVAVDEKAPEGIVEPKGYAVILGEGEYNKNIERDGNWDFEIEFQLSKRDNHLPTVNGYLICEECALSIHQHHSPTGNYVGEIPLELKSNPLKSMTSNSDLFETSVKYWVLAAAIVFILIVVIFL